MEKATCEICGKKGVKAVVFVEGAKLAVCGGCAFGKKILYLLDEEGVEEKGEARHAKTEEVEEIVEGYGKIIKKAREKLGLPISVVAERINEKESYLERIEREDVIPTFSVAKKLEKELGIKLIEKVEASVAPSGSLQKRFSEPTLGEFAEEGE